MPYPCFRFRTLRVQPFATHYEYLCMYEKQATSKNTTSPMGKLVSTRRAHWATVERPAATPDSQANRFARLNSCRRVTDGVILLNFNFSLNSHDADAMQCKQEREKSRLGIQRRRRREPLRGERLAGKLIQSPSGASERLIRSVSN